MKQKTIKISAIEGAGKKGSGIAPQWKDDWKTKVQYVEWDNRTMAHWKIYFPDWSEGSIKTLIEDTHNFAYGHLHGYPTHSIGF